MESTEAAPAEPADGDLSTIVEYLPQAPEDAFEDLDCPDLQPVDMELEPEELSRIDAGEKNKSLLSDFDEYNAEDLDSLPPLESNGLSSNVKSAPPPETDQQTENDLKETSAANSPTSEMASSELVQTDPTPTKRSLRRKTRKRVYQEDESEAELPSEEECLFPRMNSRYYSDDEYVPGSDRKSKSKNSREDSEEEDEEIVEEFPKRRRRRKKVGDQKTPLKSEKKPLAEKKTSIKKGKGRAKIKSESGTSRSILDDTVQTNESLNSAAETPSTIASQDITSVSEEPLTLDSDSDIENCLSTSKIKVEDKNKAKIKLFEDDSKKSANGAPEKKKKKSSGPSSEMGKAFENFLVANSELKIKKLTKKAKESTTQLEIPMIEPPELIKLIDSWTQTEVPNVMASEVQTSSPYAMRMSKNLPLSSEQAENACAFMKNVLNMTTELGTLICQKSKEFVDKKINADYIKDTTKVAFCKDKTSLLFKLAKDNLIKIEEMLEKDYEEYIQNNELEAAVEVDKTLQANKRDADSDCEIVEVMEEPSRKKFNANTVFLNKELSIKIAKKPAPAEVKTTAAGRQIKMSSRGGHSVWINKSIMVKKVKPNQSFLSKDSRFEKPPDNNKIADIVDSFFANYKWVESYCQPFTSSDWIVPTREKEVICYYFVVEALPKCSNLTTGSGSEDDGFFDGPGSNESIPMLNNQYDVVGAPEVRPQPNESPQSSYEPEPLVTISLKFLHNLLSKSKIGESLETATLNINKTDNPIRQEKASCLSIENLETADRKMSLPDEIDYETCLKDRNSKLAASNLNIVGNNNQSSPEKLTIISLKSLSNCYKILLSLNGWNRNKSAMDKFTLTLRSTIQLHSLKIICYQRIVSLMFKKHQSNLTQPLSSSTQHVRAMPNSETENLAEKKDKFNVGPMAVQIEKEISNNLFAKKINSLKILCMEAVNDMLDFTKNHVPKVPAITNVRQINDFNKSDDDSSEDESEYLGDNYQEFDDTQQNTWFAKIHINDLKLCLPANSIVQSNESEPTISEGITLKLEPMDSEENQPEIQEYPAAIKTENYVSVNDFMAVEPTQSDPIIPKTELPNNIENCNQDPLLNHLTEDFLDKQFDIIMRKNKLRPAGSPLAETPYDAIFSQSQQRIRREFEPDSDPENDGMNLLTVQSFRDVHVQPVSKAKGTLLQSSSDDESNKLSEALGKRKKTRSRKNKNESINNVLKPFATAAAATVSTPACKDKVPNELEVMTRRMRERIRNEEKEKRIEASTDSENEILYAFNPKGTSANEDSSNEIVPEPASVVNKESPRCKERENRRTLRSNKKQEQSNNKPNTSNDESDSKKSVSPDFPGFSMTDKSDIASYKSYLKYMQDKGIMKDQSTDLLNLPSTTNNSKNNSLNICESDNEDTIDDGEYLMDEFDYSCVDSVNVSNEIADNSISNAMVKIQPSTKEGSIIDDMGEAGLAMLTPQVDMVVDENVKVDIGPFESPVKRKGRKKKNLENNDQNPETIETLTSEGNVPVKNTETDATKSPVVGAPHKQKTSNIETTQIEIKKERTQWTLRDGWKCHKIPDEDIKLYQLCYVPMDKLPETFVQTYLEFVQLSQTEKDPEIDRLTNLKSLHRVSHSREEGIKRTPKSNSKQNSVGDGSCKASDDSEHSLMELEPSDDEQVPPEDVERIPSSHLQNIEVKTENTIAKNALMGEAGSDSETSDRETPLSAERSPGAKFMTGPKSKRKMVANKIPADPDSLVLTADKMMKKELDLLHAPVIMTAVKVSPNKPQGKAIQKPDTRERRTRSNVRSDDESDASSEEEKQWITTKEKLLRRLQKKHRDQLKIDDDKRARIVSTYIEKKTDETTSYSQSVLRQRRQRKPKKKTRKQKEKELRMLSMELQQKLVKNGELIDMNLPIHGRAGASVTTAHRGGRRNIRKVIDKKSLARSTVIANMEEFERKKRIGFDHTRLCKHLGCDTTVKAVVIDKRLCLEYDFEQSLPVVSVHEAFTGVMKAHQCEGVKFMWDASFETLDRIESGHPGGGCILAHCMGLGKTLQVLALLHTVMTHSQVGVSRVLVCCPLSTVLNWVDEIHKWMKPVFNEIKVYELSKLKKTYERAYQLDDWFNKGGIFIVGYELFRSLTTLHPYLDNIRPTIINKINSALLDPGPDIVICDEGHLLKNNCSGLAVAMSRVKTSRRIVLTGTPMQNNLREYYCMVDFVKPNLLGTYSEFSNRFENPIMNGQHRDSSEADIRLMKARSHILHRVLEGCLQRQEASVLYQYLPKKCEYTVFVALSKCQSELYRHYLEHLARRSRQSILKDFHILQKIWTHPQVLHNFQLKLRDDVPKAETKMEDDLGKEELGSEEMRAAGAGGEVWWTQYLDEGRMLDALESSNKFQVVFRILDECVRVGDKLLIFSTSLLTMDSLEYFLKTIKQWNLGSDYYRLDGSVPPEVRQKWCREFNADNNVDTRLFLISTRAGCLGLNMTAANRVIILDTSWNPAHDIQSIFRIYRFGQKKDCYIYRLVSMGTMEQKIYERSVTKQAVACRVVDEQQIDRHYNMAELTELYRFEESDASFPLGVAAGDPLLLDVARSLPAVRAVHEHDWLLRDSCDQQLPEHERAAAWDQFQREQAHTQDQSMGVKRKKKMQMHPNESVNRSMPPDAQDHASMQLSSHEMTANTSGHLPLPPNAQVHIPMPSKTQMLLSGGSVEENKDVDQNKKSSSSKYGLRNADLRCLDSSSTDSASECTDVTHPEEPLARDDSDDEDEKQSLASLRDYGPVSRPTSGPPENVVSMNNKEIIKVYSGNKPPDVEPTMATQSVQPSTSTANVLHVSKNSLVTEKHQKRPIADVRTPVDPVVHASVVNTLAERVPLHPSMLSNPYFLKIVAHTYRSWNPNLEDEAALAAAQFSADMLLKKSGDILSGTLYDIAFKALGIHTMKVLWQNYQSETQQEKPRAPSVPLPPPAAASPAPSKAKPPAPVAPAPKPGSLKLREPSTLLKPRHLEPAGAPKPVSLHIGAHPSSSMPTVLQSDTVDLSGDNDFEEESILPDDDVPRIGNASPPPPAPPPPAPAPEPTPVHRTARKKTTPRAIPANRSRLRAPSPDPKEIFDIITVVGTDGTLLPNQTKSMPPTRVTYVRKHRPMPTHMIDASNQIVPISSVPTPVAPAAPAQVPPAAPARVPPAAPPVQRPAPTISTDAPICLDSDDDDVTAIVPVSAPNQHAAVKAPSNAPQPNIVDHAIPQPAGQSAQRLRQLLMQNNQNTHLRQMNMSNVRLVQPNNMPDYDTIVRTGTRVGNIILVPASAFKGQSGVPNHAPMLGVKPQQLAPPLDMPPQQLAPPLQVPMHTTAVPAYPPVAAQVPFSVACTPVANTQAPVAQHPAVPAPPIQTPSVAIPPKTTSAPAVRGRPRKYPLTGIQQKQTPPAQPVSAVFNVDIPIRPEKPPSVPQEPSSTTGDEPSSTVDLTEERRDRSRNSSSSSRSSSSSSSSSEHSSGADDPLKLFKNVVHIPATNYGKPTSAKISKTESKKLKYDDLFKPNSSTSKSGSVPAPSKPSSSKVGLSSIAGPSSSKPSPYSSKPGLNSSKTGSVSSPTDSSVSWAKSRASSKTHLIAKKPCADVASWQIPKTLSTDTKPSSITKTAGKTPKTTSSNRAVASTKTSERRKNSSDTDILESVDLTEFPTEATSEESSSTSKSKYGSKHKASGPERVLGTVDLTDEPAAKRIASREPETASTSNRHNAINRSMGVTSTQGAKNITLTKTGAITFTPQIGGLDSAKPKVVTVTCIQTESKGAGSDKRKATAGPIPKAKKSKSIKSKPMSLEDFTIDDIMDDIIELE